MEKVKRRLNPQSFKSCCRKSADTKITSVSSCQQCAKKQCCTVIEIKWEVKLDGKKNSFRSKTVKGGVAVREIQDQRMLQPTVRDVSEAIL